MKASLLFWLLLLSIVRYRCDGFSAPCCVKNTEVSLLEYLHVTVRGLAAVGSTQPMTQRISHLFLCITLSPSLAYDILAYSWIPE